MPNLNRLPIHSPSRNIPNWIPLVLICCRNCLHDSMVAALETKLKAKTEQSEKLENPNQALMNRVLKLEYDIKRMKEEIGVLHSKLRIELEADGHGHHRQCHMTSKSINM
jgi:hypothetical protein